MEQQKLFSNAGAGDTLKQVELLIYLAESLKARYFFRLEDGTEHKNMELPTAAPARAKRRPYTKKSPSRDYVTPYIKNMRIGDAVEIPCPREGKIINSCTVRKMALGELQRKFGDACIVTASFESNEPHGNEGYVVVTLSMRKTEARHGN